MKGELQIDKVVIRDMGQAERLVQKGFGTRKDSCLELSLLEALFLVDRGTLEVDSNDRAVSWEELIGKGVEEGDLNRRFGVYKDLRERGYVVKTGFKFGAHFRVYDRGDYPKGEHSKLLVHVVPEDEVMSFPEVSRAVRLAQGVKKQLYFAVVDTEGDITYYLVDRIIL